MCIYLDASLRRILRKSLILAVQCAVCSVQCAVCSVQCTVCSVCSVQCAVCITPSRRQLSLHTHTPLKPCKTLHFTKIHFANSGSHRDARCEQWAVSSEHLCKECKPFLLIMYNVWICKSRGLLKLSSMQSAKCKDSQTSESLVFL